MNRNVVKTKFAPSAIGPYSQGIRTENFVFASGQLGLNPETGQLREGVAEQTEQIMRNLAAILEAAGSSLDNIIKTTIFLADINDFAAVNSVYAQSFSDEPPARSTIQVAALPLGGAVEIEAIALVE